MDIESQLEKLYETTRLFAAQMADLELLIGHTNPKAKEPEPTVPKEPSVEDERPDLLYLNRVIKKLEDAGVTLHTQTYLIKSNEALFGGRNPPLLNSMQGLKGGRYYLNGGWCMSNIKCEVCTRILEGLLDSLPKGKDTKGNGHSKGHGSDSNQGLLIP